MSAPGIMTEQDSTLRSFLFTYDNGNSRMHNSYWMIEFVVLISKGLFLLFLATLLVLSLLSWVWIASFRAGWQTFHWLLRSGKERTNEQISFGLLYGLIVLIMSPIALVYEWSQNQLHRYLPAWIQPSIDAPLCQIIKDRLAIQLNDEFPGIEPASRPQLKSADDE